MPGDPGNRCLKSACVDQQANAFVKLENFFAPDATVDEADERSGTEPVLCR